MADVPHMDPLKPISFVSAYKIMVAKTRGVQESIALTYQPRQSQWNVRYVRTDRQTLQSFWFLGRSGSDSIQCNLRPPTSTQPFTVCSCRTKEDWTYPIRARPHGRIRVEIRDRICRIRKEPIRFPPQSLSFFTVWLSPVFASDLYLWHRRTWFFLRVIHTCYDLLV